MIFVDTNVFMYAVGRRHPLRAEARSFFSSALETKMALYTSAEVVQELLHAYLPVNRIKTLDSAMELISRLVVDVWPLEFEDVELARQLYDQFPQLGGRDLSHLASCRRRGTQKLMTFDRALAAIAEKRL